MRLLGLLFGRLFGFFAQAIAAWAGRRLELARERRRGRQEGRAEGAAGAVKELTEKREAEIAERYDGRTPSAEELTSLFKEKP